ncbi:hypothetical protein ACP4OV_002235 [Aristida adscensionis]
MPTQTATATATATAAAMADGGSDRLSELPDDLLQNILRFAPSKEAASTAALSRRWRSLWPSPWHGVVILDSRSYDHIAATHDDDDGDGDGSRSSIKREAFFRGARAALAAHGPAGVRRLAVHVEAGHGYAVHRFMSHRDLAAGVLRHPACRRVEDLRVGARVARDGRTREDYSHHDQCNEWSLPREAGLYGLDLGDVPSEALRVLHVAGASELRPPPPGAAFARLEALRLRRCSVAVDTLQDMIMASPQLATLRLEFVVFETRLGHYDGRRRSFYYCGGERQTPSDELCCPGVTTLASVNCGRDHVRLDAPRVRHFTYRGHLSQFPLVSPPPDVAAADLQFIGTGHQVDRDETRILFWEMVSNFRNAMALKLKFNWPIEDIAVADEELPGGAQLGNLEQLEVEGQYLCASESAAAAIRNFLHCCPVVRDLRLKLDMYTKKGFHFTMGALKRKKVFLDQNAQADFTKSIERFRRHKVRDDDDDHDDDVPDIPGLSKYRFDCLQGYLRRLRLQFLMDKPNGFGTQLVKFFVENAAVLEEIYIDDGNQKLGEHINHKVYAWSGNSSGQTCTGLSQEFCNNKQFNSSNIGQKFLRRRQQLQKRNSQSADLTVLPLER